VSYRGQSHANRSARLDSSPLAPRQQTRLLNALCSTRRLRTSFRTRVRLRGFVRYDHHYPISGRDRVGHLRFGNGRRQQRALMLSGDDRKRGHHVRVLFSRSRTPGAD
jgi:hypothetical protein